jgi:anti-anti-sigma regulatory factor
MTQTTHGEHVPSADGPELRVQAVLSDHDRVVLELIGTVRRSTVGLLGECLAATSADATSVVIDLTAVGVPNHWLLSGLAKAHALLDARDATMRLIVGDDTTFELLHTAGLHRFAPIFLSRTYDESVSARVARRSARAHDRQRVIDLTDASRARGRVGVVTYRRGHVPLRPTGAY